MSEDRCVMCGEIIPEGRMFCPMCEKGRRDTSRTRMMLRSYRDMEWKARNAEQIIRECNDMMTSLGGFSAGAKVQGGGNTRESLLVNCIERKTRVEAAVNFMKLVNGAIGALDPNEREIIFNFHIDHSGIGWVCRTYHVAKTRAYELCDNALAHLDSLMF